MDRRDAAVDRIARVQDAEGRVYLCRVHGPGLPEEVELEPLRGDLLGEGGGELVGAGRGGGAWLRGDQVRFLPPVLPGKVVGIGSNYRDHAREMGRPLPPVPKLFLKPPSAVIGHGDAIELPPGTARVDHEAELGLVVGRRLRRVSEAEALDGLLGVVALCDVTARDLQQQDGVFARAKGFDTFCPLGPWLARGLDPHDRVVRCDILREGAWRRVQDGTSADMVFGPAQLLSFVSKVMTLEPGDVIATGTPAGVGPLHRGEVVRIEVGGVGVLQCPVEDRADRDGA